MRDRRTRRRGCWCPGRSSATCDRWGRAGTRASPSARAGSGRARSRSAATAASATTRGDAARRDLQARAKRMERRGRAAARAAPRAALRAGADRCARRARATTCAAVLAELGRGGRAERAGVDPAGGARVIDRRGESPLAVLGRRGRRRRRRAGAVRRRPAAAGAGCRRAWAVSRSPATRRSTATRRSRTPTSSWSLLDPPARRRRSRPRGAGYAQLAWGEPELRFAQQIHELEYGLRASLVALYRALRERERAAGEELELLLRGEGPHGRSARLAARLVRVLAELELVSLDRDLPALAIASVTPTELDRSPSYRVYAQRYEDGRRFLSSANPPPSA